ncbi:MAG TPA: ROK family protein [Candidatus Limnocylindrales bacterium]|nr:ROK family protein [Candidatus Limnocylindrales bacterium]
MNSARYTIGVDLGGTNLRIAAYSQSPGILDHVNLPTRLHDGRDAVVRDMCGAIQKLIAEYSRPLLVGIGIGSPGPIELPEGRLRHLPNLPGWDGFELRATVERILGMSVIVENDANLAALAECLLGKGKTLGLDSLCMLTLGTGVGNGIIIHGKIWDGMNGMGGEAGHATIWPDGHVCGCGSNGCLEQYASATAIRRLAEETMARTNAPGLVALRTIDPGFSSLEVAQLARDGDAEAQSIFDLVGRSLGIGLGALVNTLNLPLYVVGGGVAQAWDLFAPKMFAELTHRSYVYRLTDGQLDEFGHRSAKTYVEPAALGAESGILGACLLPWVTLESSSKSQQA